MLVMKKGEPDSTDPLVGIFAFFQCLPEVHNSASSSETRPTLIL